MATGNSRHFLWMAVQKIEAGYFIRAPNKVYERPGVWPTSLLLTSFRISFYVRRNFQFRVRSSRNQKIRLMKLKTIFPFAAVILLPFSIVSCGDNEEAPAEEAPAEEAAPAPEPAPAPAPAPAALNRRLQCSSPGSHGGSQPPASMFPPVWAYGRVLRVLRYVATINIIR